MRNERLIVMTEIALAIALAAVLNLPPLRIHLPVNIAGGTVSLTMLPILVIAMRRGVAAGVTAGALFGLVDLAMEPYVVHPVQLLLDYPVAFGLVGLAGVGAAVYRSTRSPLLRWGALFGGLLLGVIGRFASHWLSGVVFFGASAPAGQPVWLYSAVYNATYLLPSFAITAVAAALVFPVLERAVPARGLSGRASWARS